MKHSKYNNTLFQGAQSCTFNNAKFLRQNQTEAENLLWSMLRNKKLKGFKFRRQHPISNFVADFYCAERKLIVELDGAMHNSIEGRSYDKARTKFLNNSKVSVIRFKNQEVIKNIDKVLREILNVLEKV